MPAPSACRRKTALAALLIWASFSCFAQRLPLPPRPKGASTGSELAHRLASLGLAAREAEVSTQVLAGNVPQFLRSLCPVSITNSVGGITNRVTFFVTPDYLALGSDADYLLMPLSPQTAQRIADALDCSLPTPRMVDAIYSAAQVKLAPEPIPPSPAMTSVPVFAKHNQMVWAQRAACLNEHPLGALVAGDKKDVVLCAGLASASGKVAIYGWHRTNGVPIQPLYLGHSATWVDYSQCIRLVQQNVLVNGQTNRLARALANPELAHVLSGEGALSHIRYATNLSTRQPGDAGTSALKPVAEPAPLAGAPEPTLGQGVASPPSGDSGLPFTNSPVFNERIAFLNLEPDVRVCVNAPGADSFTPHCEVLLVFYALPNGNTIEQTIGKKLQPGDDWHFGIQQIGAQVRFVRQRLKKAEVVVAYLENRLKSWPAWRREHGDAPIPGILERIRQGFNRYQTQLVLSGHSGGGSLIFGYLNTVERIPNDLVRLAFLDSDYAYAAARGHARKLTDWLAEGTNHFLCVLAYNDAVARLNGRPFVSLEGGTWGKSHSMEADLARSFSFNAVTNEDFEIYTALNGRVRFLLKKNPEGRVLHTVQVERNGFIHSLLCGTPDEDHGYQYYGPRAYEDLVEP